MIGFLGGTGMTRLLDDDALLDVETPWATVPVQVGTLDGLRLAFVERHGPGHATPPHRVDHRANLWALRACGATAVLALNNTGGLRTELGPGTVVVPDDLYDATAKPHTVFDDAVHIDMSLPYCPHVRAALLDALAATGLNIQATGTYVQSIGPRMETRAEIRHFATLGDVVGMTGAAEAIIARELGLCYATVCFVANHAAGVTDAPVDAQEIRRALAERAPVLADALARAARALPEPRDCGCATAAERGRLTE